MIQNWRFLMNGSTLVNSTDEFDSLAHVWCHSTESATKFPRDQWCIILSSEIIMKSSLFCRCDRSLSLSSRRLISLVWMNIFLFRSDHSDYLRSCSLSSSEMIFKRWIEKTMIDTERGLFMHISLFLLLWNSTDVCNSWPTVSILIWLDQKEQKEDSAAKWM